MRALVVTACNVCGTILLVRGFNDPTAITVLGGVAFGFAWGLIAERALRGQR